MRTACWPRRWHSAARNYGDHATGAKLTPAWSHCWNGSWVASGATVPPGGGDPARRVRIRATLAPELYFDQAAGRGWSYANEALDAARRLGQTEELGIAVSAYLLSALVTDHLGTLPAGGDAMPH